MQKNRRLFAVGFVGLIVICLLVFILYLSAPQIGNVFENIADGLDGTPGLMTEISVQPTQQPLLTDAPFTVEIHETQVEVATRETTEAQAASLTGTPTPTLSTEQYSTALANLATAQTSPTRRSMPGY